MDPFVIVIVMVFGATECRCAHGIYSICLIENKLYGEFRMKGDEFLSLQVGFEPATIRTSIPLE